MDSTQAQHYGTEAEEQVADSLNLELDREPWKDAVDRDGTPYEVKAAVQTRSSGRPGRFRLFKRPHSKLQSAGGRYVFVVYRVRGTGIQILRRRTVPASELSPEWTPSNHNSPNRELQTKVDIEEVFR